MKMTITEALAEVKTIGARLQAKRAAIKQYIGRPDGLRDPLEKEGGSVALIQRETQAIGDLNQRLIDLRVAIIRVNDQTSVTIGGATRTIAQWLAWKRDVAPGEQAYWGEITQTLKAIRDQARTRGANVVAPGAAQTPQDVIVNIDETSVLKAVENLRQTLGELDGKLSLVNATTTIEIPD